MKKSGRPKWLPKHVYVGSDCYEVRLSKMRDCGQTHAHPQRIQIRTGMSPRETLNTFIHEVIHAGCFSGELPEDKIKHKRIYELADFFTAFLLDNYGAPKE